MAEGQGIPTITEIRRMNKAELENLLRAYNTSIPIRATNEQLPIRLSDIMEAERHEALRKTAVSKDNNETQATHSKHSGIDNNSKTNTVKNPKVT